MRHKKDRNAPELYILQLSQLMMCGAAILEFAFFKSGLHPIVVKKACQRRCWLVIAAKFNHHLVHFHSCMNAKCAKRNCFSTFSNILILCRERWRVRDRQNETEGERKTGRERETHGATRSGRGLWSPSPCGKVTCRAERRLTVNTVQPAETLQREQSFTCLQPDCRWGVNRWGSGQVTSSRTALPSSDQHQPIWPPITLDIFYCLFVFIQCTVLLGFSLKLIWLYFFPFVVTEKYFSFTTWGKMSWTQLLRWDQVDVWCKEWEYTRTACWWVCAMCFRIVLFAVIWLHCAAAMPAAGLFLIVWLMTDWSFSTIQFLLNCEVYCLWHISSYQMFDNQIWGITTKSCVHVCMSADKLI